jgi:hypothetical protein
MNDKGIWQPIVTVPAGVKVEVSTIDAHGQHRPFCAYVQRTPEGWFFEGVPLRANISPTHWRSSRR